MNWIIRLLLFLAIVASTTDHATAELGSIKKARSDNSQYNAQRLRPPHRLRDPYDESGQGLAYNVIRGTIPFICEIGGVEVTFDVPKGYLIYPAWKKRGYQHKCNLPYNLDVTFPVLDQRISKDDLPLFRVVELSKDGTPIDITLEYSHNSIIGGKLEGDTFALLAPISAFDKIPPTVSLNNAYGRTVNNTIYASSTSPIGLTVNDTSSHGNYIPGVSGTYFALDNNSRSGCFEPGITSIQRSAHCKGFEYKDVFTLSEGTHSISYIAVDKADNWSLLTTTTIYIDATAPVSFLARNDTLLPPGTTMYAATSDTFTVSAIDLLSNGVASGITTTYLLIDISPEECEYLEWSGGLDGMGTCENRFFSHPFNLPAGEHILYFYSEDNVGITEAQKSVTIIVDSNAKSGRYTDTISHHKTRARRKTAKQSLTS